MQDWPSEISELAAEINSCKYLYLKSIWEPSDNQLGILIEEARAGRETTLELDGGNIHWPARKIESTSDCRLFEIRWKNYVGYSVQNESYALPDKKEVFLGNLFCLYEKSNFLDYTRQTTYSIAEEPSPILHIGIHCLNHELDVIATSVPEIARLRSPQIPVV